MLMQHHAVVRWEELNQHLRLLTLLVWLTPLASKLLLLLLLLLKVRL